MSHQIKFVFYTLVFLSQLALAQTPSTDIICDSNTRKTALVVIDMQPVFVTRGGNDKDPANKKKVEEVLAAQVEAIENAKKYKIPIIFLEYEGPFGDTNSLLKDAVKNYGTVKFFKKNTDGMFESYNKGKSELVAYLKQNKVANLVITGANGGACVLRSITGSLDGNCNVLAYSKGIADFNYREFIYPYSGQYKGIKPNCKDCKFRETASIDDIVEDMARGSNLPRSTPANNESVGVR
jgi:nicotinamidase-related amidase